MICLPGVLSPKFLQSLSDSPQSREERQGPQRMLAVLAVLPIEVRTLLKAGKIPYYARNDVSCDHVLLCGPSRPLRLCGAARTRIDKHFRVTILSQDLLGPLPQLPRQAIVLGERAGSQFT
jgi:hypothetical protein